MKQDINWAINEIKECLKETQKDIKDHEFDSDEWHRAKGEALGYMTVLETLKKCLRQQL